MKTDDKIITDGLELEPFPTVEFSPEIKAGAIKINALFFNAYLREKYGKWRWFNLSYWKLRLFTGWR